jgi:hypothetical protein
VCGHPAVKEVSLDLVDVTSFYRIQINGRYPAGQLAAICRLHKGHNIVAQYFGDNDEILRIDEPNLSILVDGSGGNGILPTRWPKLDTDLPVGFAGGIGPHNMLQEVLRIRSVAREGWWVDMESYLRVDEWFSLRKVQQALDAFNKALEMTPVCQLCGYSGAMAENNNGEWYCCNTEMHERDRLTADAHLPNLGCGS